MSAVAVAAAFGPLPPANPFAGPVGTSTMHGDTASSDTTPYHGPSGAPNVRFQELGAACPPAPGRGGGADCPSPGAGPPLPAPAGGAQRMAPAPLPPAPPASPRR